MRRVLVLSIFALASLLAAALLFSLRLQALLASSARDASGSMGAEERTWCLTAVIPSPASDPFYGELKKSVLLAAAERDAAMRFIEYKPGVPALDAPLDSQSVSELVASCASMGIHGLLTAVPDSPALRCAIDACASAGIPVVTLEYDSPSSRRRSFIGTNDFREGELAGAIVTRLRPRGGRAVLILPGQASPYASGRESLRQGFMSAVSRVPGIRVVDILDSPDSALAGQELIRSILRSRPEVDTLFLGTAMDSLGAAEALIDANRVGQVALVGPADSPEGRNHARNGVISAAITRDPELSGRECVRVLLDLCITGNASAFVDTGLSVISADPALESLAASGESGP